MIYNPCLNKESILEAIELLRKKLLEPIQKYEIMIPSTLFYGPIKGKYKTWRELSGYYKDKYKSESFKKIIKKSFNLL